MRDAPCSRYDNVHLADRGWALTPGTVGELALEACRAAGLVPAGGGPSPLGGGLLALSASTSKGDPLAIDRALAGDPRHWQGSWPGDLEPALARSLGLRHFIPAPVAAACSTGLYGLLAVADALESGRVDQGLVVASEGSLPAWLAAGFARLGVLAVGAPDTSLAGRGHQSLGFVPAAGAAAIRLVGRNRPSPLPSPSWKLLAGVRLGDAGHETHFVNPETLRSALRALWQVTGRPTLLIPHATGTVAGDHYEAEALRDGPWHDVPRWCPKPQIGHTLGASGLIELTLGLATEAAAFGAGAVVWKISLGFGGHLAAVAVQRCGSATERRY